MKKQIIALTLTVVTILGLTGCKAKNDVETQQPNNTSIEQKKEEVNKKITYLGKEYTVPSKAERIVITGSLESMEDALVLGVKPVGAISIGGKFPEMFSKIVDKAESIGEKAQPNVETILKLKPDVILATSKFPAETMEKISKITTTIPVSHIATDWEANLLLLGELSGKEKEAKEAIQKYNNDIKTAKEKFDTALKGKKVIAIRIRSGNISIYPSTIFFNPVLYTDLGLEIPEPVKAAKAQETISLEKFSELNPDYIFVQFSQDENADKPKALEDLQNNPIWKSINAVKNGKVYVNVVDPLAQGGTAWSKTAFLKAAVDNLTK
jgi:iron complex transport system substrate-binding protein